MIEPLLVVILGPTASGKTGLSLRLAERFHGEIVSCDSVAVYREFEIGTAKPSREERARVPHHLIDAAGPTDLVTAGDYSRQARGAIQEISARGRLPIVVGGTGLYLRALLEGLFAGPPRSEELRARLRARSEERGPQYLHRLLRRIDPKAAHSIHSNDVAKVIRALEISITARAPMSAMWKEGREPLRGFRILRIGLNPEREALYARINARAREMFSAGLVDETRGLLERYPAARPLTSLGYKQAMQHLRGELTLEHAISAAQQGHRNYAKRQMTWFRREPGVEWYAGFGSAPEIQKAVEESLADRARIQVE
ncbi:MAG TPA: tRNA (adenosine(37)-N6)-dimethylallyltransferase MiaA [Candidatus Angelobacter sp.]|nr:tRNA (adenosine(37)-N6)-dimethylallyltransferase MiaA [Candidatus Angelobacter sp.]